MENQIDTAKTENESESLVPKKSSIKMIIWDIVCFILFATGIAFLIIFWDKAKYDYPVLYYKEVIIVSTIAVIFIAFWCFFSSLKKITAVKFVFMVLAGIMLAANWFIYFRYVPKYWVRDGCAIVQADPKYASAIIEPRYNRMYDKNGRLLASSSAEYKIENNPFWDTGDILNVIKYGKVIAWIAFDNVTGKYEVIYEPEDEYGQ